MISFPLDLWPVFLISNTPYPSSRLPHTVPLNQECFFGPPRSSLLLSYPSKLSSDTTSLWDSSTSPSPCSLSRMPFTYYRKWKWSPSVVSDSQRPHGLQSTRLLRPWDFPGKNTGVGCHFLLQGIFPTQGWNPGLPHCRQRLYRLSQQGSPFTYYSTP